MKQTLIVATACLVNAVRAEFTSVALPHIQRNSLMPIWRINHHVPGMAIV